MGFVLRNPLLLAVILALPVAAALGDVPPNLTARIICPAEHTRLQFVSSDHSGKTHEIDVSVYCVVGETYKGCVWGRGPCRRQPVSAFLAYPGIFVVGWVFALIPALVISLLRRRHEKKRRADGLEEPPG